MAACLPVWVPPCPQAALKIQAAYRAYFRRTKYWGRYVKLMSAATMIQVRCHCAVPRARPPRLFFGIVNLGAVCVPGAVQKVARSWMARVRFARWRASFLRTMNIVQSIARRKLALIALRREKRLLSHAAIDIQRVWKGYVLRQLVLTTWAVVWLWGWDAITAASTAAAAVVVVVATATAAVSLLDACTDVGCKSSQRPTFNASGAVWHWVSIAHPPRRGGSLPS